MGLKFKKLRHNLFSVMITDVKNVFSCSWGASAVLELVEVWSWTLSSQLLCVLSQSLLHIPSQWFLLSGLLSL